MKRLILAVLVVCSLTLMGSGAALAEELRVGVVNIPKLLEQSPQKEAADRLLGQRFDPRLTELKSEAEAIKQLEERLQKDGATMAAAQKASLERELRDRTREFKRAEENFREDLNLARNEEYGKVQRAVLQAIIAVSEQEKFDLVLTEGVVYASARVDITDKVLARLREAMKGGN